MKNYNLRLRNGLFFLAIFVGFLILLVSGLMAGFFRGGSVESLVIAGVITGFGMLGLLSGIWYLYDENVAKPVDRIAAELRSRAHTDVAATIDENAARYLGDLGPAARAISQRLGEDVRTTEEQLAAQTENLETDRRQLAALLTKIPVAVIMLGHDDRIALYDEQAASLLTTRPLTLGRTIFEYFDRESLQALRESGRGTLLSADKQQSFKADCNSLDDDSAPDNRSGYLLTLREHEGSRAGERKHEVVVEDTMTATKDVFDQRGKSGRLSLSRSLVFDFRLSRQKPTPVKHDIALNDLLYVVFDTETTGLDSGRDELVQIGAVRILNQRIIEGEFFNTLVNPQRPIPASSTRIHNIDDNMVQYAPPPLTAVERFAGFAEDAVLVAHNAPFDMAFMQRALNSSAATLKHPILDTVLLSAEVFGTSDELTLDALAERLSVKLPHNIRHTALGDAIATAEILIKLIQILDASGIHTLEEAIQVQKRHVRLLADLNT